MWHCAQMTCRDPIGQCLTNCNLGKLRHRSPRNANLSIASTSFLPRLGKPYRPDNRLVWMHLNGRKAINAIVPRYGCYADLGVTQSRLLTLWADSWQIKRKLSNLTEWRPHIHKRCPSWSGLNHGCSDYHPPTGRISLHNYMVHLLPEVLSGVWGSHLILLAGNRNIRVLAVFLIHRRVQNCAIQLLNWKTIVYLNL